MKIAVIGSGSWGIASSLLLHRNGHEVVIWSFSEEERKRLLRKHANKDLLPGVKLPKKMVITCDISCAANTELIVLAVPSFAVSETAERLLPHIHNAKAVALLSKGFDKEHGYCLLSETLEQTFGGVVPIVALTGPSHAEEVARSIPTAVVAASGKKAAAELVQKAFMNEHFRVYTTPDIVGAEIGGAMKNVLALAVGIADGMGYGDNTKAMLMTRGLTEMMRFGVFFGGKSETFSGLSGAGDLIVTCVSQHSRNRRAGLLIGDGMPPEEAIEKVGAVVEGYFATQAVHKIAEGRGLDLPVSKAMYALLFEGAPLAEVARSLFTRSGRAEIDEVFMSHIEWPE